LSTKLFSAITYTAQTCSENETQARKIYQPLYPAIHLLYTALYNPDSNLDLQLLNCKPAYQLPVLQKMSTPHLFFLQIIVKEHV